MALTRRAVSIPDTIIKPPFPVAAMAFWMNKFGSYSNSGIVILIAAKAVGNKQVLGDRSNDNDAQSTFYAAHIRDHNLSAPHHPPQVIDHFFARKSSSFAYCS